MSSEYLSFNAELSRIDSSTNPEKIKSMLDVSLAVDMSKRCLLQHKVQNFTAADVITLAELMLARESGAK